MSCLIGNAELMGSADTEPDAPTRILRLVGVYDADNTLRGELAYWVGARLGRRHCSLCDITHGLVRRRAEWAVCEASLPVQFDTFHRNDQPGEVREAAHGHAPVVLAETSASMIVLLSPADIDACDGSIDLLLSAIERAAASRGLRWPAPST